MKEPRLHLALVRSPREARAFVPPTKRARGLRLALGALGLLALALPVAALAGHPVVAFAESASMQPALRVGDGFVVQPFARSVDAGDVIVYESITRGGALAVHRVVDVTRDGLVTRGDANPRTDQAMGEPPVTPDRVRGRVVERPDGSLFTLPHLAAPLLAAQRFAGSPARLLGLVAVAGALVLAFAPPSRSKSRAPRASSPLRRALPHGLLVKHAAAFTLLVFAALGAGLVHAARDDVPLSLVVADEAPPNQHRSAPPGAAALREVDVDGYAAWSTLVLVEPSPRVTVESAETILPAGGSERIRASQHADEARGLQRDELVVWRYARIMPDAWTRALHDAAPGLPALAPLAPPLAALGAWYAMLRAGNVPLSTLTKRREDPA